METVVGAYQCEWKTAIEDESSRKRFRQFVNSDESDKNVVFVQERAQIRPATEAELDTLVKSGKGTEQIIDIVELA